MRDLAFFDEAIFNDVFVRMEKVGVSESVRQCEDACREFIPEVREWLGKMDEPKKSTEPRLGIGMWSLDRVRTLRQRLLSCAALVQFAVFDAQT